MGMSRRRVMRLLHLAPDADFGDFASTCAGTLSAIARMRGGWSVGATGRGEPAARALRRMERVDAPEEELPINPLQFTTLQFNFPGGGAHMQNRVLAVLTCCLLTASPAFALSISAPTTFAVRGTLLSGFPELVSIAVSATVLKSVSLEGALYSAVVTDGIVARAGLPLLIREGAVPVEFQPIQIGMRYARSHGTEFADQRLFATYSAQLRWVWLNGRSHGPEIMVNLGAGYALDGRDIQPEGRIAFGYAFL